MKTFIFLVSFIFIIGFVSATGDFDDTPDFGYNNKNGPILIPAVNYSLIPTVNNSKYFDGYSVETLYTHYKSLFDLVFAPITEPLSLHLNQDNWFNDSNGWINWDGNSNEFNESKLSTIYYDTNIATGSNTLDGLSDGDINVSVVYYDTLTAKSPAITCSEDWCSVSFPKYQKTLWIQKDNNWNILDIVYDDISYTKQEFNSQICSINSMTLNICVKLNNKIERLQDKRICENSKYLWDGECFEMIKTKTTYTNAIETIQIPVKIEVAKNCTMLNSILQVETYACSEYIETGKMINEVQFKEGCNWNGEYYCETRENR